ncbi:hypothetical protein ES708_09243 [subsurface metagenome]
MIVWSNAFLWLTTILFKDKKSALYRLTQGFVISATIIFIIISHESAFKFLFIPLILFVIRQLVTIVRFDKLSVRSASIPFILIAAITILYYHGQMFPTFRPNADVHDLKVMTYNILGDADVTRRMKVIETIRREQPDVLCCTEFNPRTDPPLFQNMLSDIYPYSVSNRDENSWMTGELILSRYPIRLKRNVQIPHIEYGPISFIFSEIDVDGRIVNVVNVHLTSSGHHIEQAAELPATISEKIKISTEPERIRDETKFTQARLLLDYISDFKDPTIVCGDYNDTPNSRVYRLFKKHLINAHAAGGWGLGSTFGESWLKNKNFMLPARDIIRIDHIFVSSNVDVISSKVVKDAKGSDHKPVIGVFRFSAVENSGE